MSDATYSLVAFLIGIPTWLMPLYVVYLTLRRTLSGERRKALVGGGLACLAWLGATIAYVVIGLVIEPCIHACDRQRTPTRDALLLLALASYSAVLIYVALRLHRHGRGRAT